MQNLSFFDGLISLHIMTVTNGRTSLLRLNSILLCGFTHSSAAGHLSCSHILATVNKEVIFGGPVFFHFAKYFQDPSRCSTCHYIISFHCQITFHCTAIPHCIHLCISWWTDFSGGASGKELSCQSRRYEMQVQSLSREGPLEEGTATRSSILAWRIPWTEEPDEL